MKCITFSFYKSYYYFIIFWIASILISFLISKYNNQKVESQKNNRNIQVTSEIINIISQIGGDLLAGFLVLYTYLSTNSVILNEKENNIINKNDYLIDNGLCKKINRCTLILVVSILEFICKSINIIVRFYYIQIEIGEIMCLFSITILSRIIFSHYIIKINLYKHHFISLVIFLIGYFIMGILAFIAGDIKFERWPYLIFTIVKNIFIGLEDVLIKVLLDNKYMLPHVIMFLRGLYNSGMAIILIISIKYSDIEFTFQSDINIYFIFIFFIIVWFFYNFFAMKLIYIFTPHHISFLNIVFFMILLFLYRISNNYSIVITICEIIISLFMIFASLLFSEMIIINGD